jgi:hypothetical protein
MRRRKRESDDLEAAVAEALESAARARADGAAAEQAKRRGLELKASIQAYNEANGFARWIFDDLAGGSA